MLKNTHDSHLPAIYDLSAYGILKISGHDAQKFLQGQLTCDVEQLSHAGALAAHCNPQGRVVSLFYLLAWQQEYYLIMANTLIPFALAQLKKYAVFFKVELTDLTPTLQCLGFMGNAPHAFATLPIIHLPLRKPGGIAFAATDEINQLKNIIQAEHTIHAYSQWHQTLIELNLPTLHPETSAKFLPHELNLLHFHAVNFDKGCYTGQEIIARMHYRGKLKTHFRHLIVSSTMAPHYGNEINISHYDERSKTMGCIIDFCKSIELANTYHVLVVIKEKSE